MPAEVQVMARRKVGRPLKQTSETPERETIIHMKGSPEYVDFLEAVHRKTHIPKAQLFRIAFAEWCERNGHAMPPEI